MPEGPEIKRAADRIADVLEGERLEDIALTPAGLKRYAPQLRKASIQSVKPRAKALLITFSNGLTMYSHNQLYGIWIVTKPGVIPTTSRSLRIALHTKKGSAWLYSATAIEFLDEAGLALHPLLSKLGPDVLDKTLGWRDVAARLRSDAFKRRQLASLYLDQCFLAGVGNYLRSEILFAAGLPGTAKPGQLSRGELGKLARASLRLSQQAYDTGGVTNSLRRYKKLRAEGQSFEASRFYVFARANKPCFECGRKIRKITANARRLYYCPRCQNQAGN